MTPAGDNDDGDSVDTTCVVSVNVKKKKSDAVVSENGKRECEKRQIDRDRNRIWISPVSKYPRFGGGIPGSGSASGSDRRLQPGRENMKMMKGRVWPMGRREDQGPSTSPDKSINQHQNRIMADSGERVKVRERDNSNRKRKRDTWDVSISLRIP
ncbi:hypothetical protein BOTBODRAFT_38574 [Botryobasidium botryosum FD-172 SS1]|uniref:Uncharacterized protein n=1 Tax=Botryobasidium botryosum (strain FD-172 SS1) TaxID=930990 RepID=A0A067M716_BOTB1|nr:hypothetical protein BOTBODRAFT_38574 [Botryobasidium botryosum FD-172 SS1]